MCEIMKEQLFESLKGYYRAEEKSDKVLYIIEVDESNVQKRKAENEDLISSSSKKTKQSNSPTKESCIEIEAVNSDESSSPDGNLVGFDNHCNQTLLGNSQHNNQCNPTLLGNSQHSNESVDKPIVCSYDNDVKPATNDILEQHLSKSDKESPQVNFNDAFVSSATNVVRDRNHDAYSVFPVHSLILSINSSYFKTVTSVTGMQESNQKHIDVKVKKGEGKYVEMLINSFYDQDILKTMNASDLLNILELANRFICDPLIKCILKLLERSLVFKTVEECNQILQQIKFLRAPMASALLKKSFTTLTNLCVKFLVEYFVAIDCSVEKHDKFYELSFDSLLILLSCNHRILWHENNYVYFIINWLSANDERQTEEKISKILQQLRYQYMTARCFKDILTINHVILSKWRGYTKWYVDALLYHSLTSEDRISCEMTKSLEERTLKLSYPYNLQACALKVVHIGDTFMSLGNHRYIIHNGYHLTPTIKFEKINDGKTWELVLRMNFGSNIEKKIEHFNLTFEIAFGVFLNFKTISFDKCNNNNFVCKNYRSFPVKFNKSNVFQTTVGTIDEELFQKFITDGIGVSIVFKGLNDWPSYLAAGLCLPELHRTIRSVDIRLR